MAKEKKLTNVMVQVSNTKEFLKMFINDPDTKYPVVISGRTSVRPNRPGFSEWLRVIMNKEEFIDILSSWNIAGQYPVRFGRYKDQTSIDLAAGGRLELDAEKLEEKEVFDRELTYVMTASPDELKKIYEKMI